jgi:hypothetical protein
MNLFTLNDLSVSASDEAASERSGKQDILRGQLPLAYCITVDNLKDLCGRLPEPGDIYYLWSLKSFNAFSFIRYVLSEVSYASEVILSSYNISRAVFLDLMTLVDSGVIERLHLTLSDVAKTRFPQVYELVRSEAAQRPSVEILYLWNHSKVSLIHSGDDHFVIEGSGNFSENSRHEQYIFLNNRDIYEFRAKWIRNKIL